MSAHYSGGSSAVIFATANFVASTVNASFCGWVQATVVGAGLVRPVWYITDSGAAHGYHLYWDSTNLLTFGQDSGVAPIAFSPSPTITDWIFWGAVMGPAGAGSVKVYYRDNASGALTLLTTTGIAAFTPTIEAEGQFGNSSSTPEANFYNYFVFDGQMTAAQMLAQSLQVAPISAAGLTLKRWIRQDNGATAGTDYSGNGFNMTNSGTITDGATNPTFPSTSAAALLLANSAGF